MFSIGCPVSAPDGKPAPGLLEPRRQIAERAGSVEIPRQQVPAARIERHLPAFCGAQRFEPGAHRLRRHDLVMRPIENEHRYSGRHGVERCGVHEVGEPPQHVDARPAQDQAGPRASAATPRDRRTAFAR